MKVTLLDRRIARADLRDATVRVVEDRVFSVTRPPLDPALWCENVCVVGTIRGLRYVGTNPTLHDAEDSEVLAALVAAHHDYPSEDLFFALMENAR